MRFAIALCLLIFPGAIFAQPVDCNAIKTTLIPYELRYRQSDSDTSVLQMFRDSSKDYVAWSAHMANGTYSITKSVVSPGSTGHTETELQSPGQPKSRVIADGTTKGVPKGFDWSKNITFTTEANSSSTGTQLKLAPSSINWTYIYVSTERINVGSCILAANVGYVSFTLPGNPTSYQRRIYFPEISANVTETVTHAAPLAPILLQFTDIGTNFPQLHFDP
jgi:hypothetical protein